MQQTENQSTEQKILIAAEKEFLDKGFNGARTTAIAERAGVTHAMLHYYFRTKEKLYERIISGKMEMIREVVVGSVEAPVNSVEDLIRRLINTHLDFIAANPTLPRFIIGELYGQTNRGDILKEKIREHAPAMIALFQKMLDTLTAKEGYQWIDARRLLLDILALNIFPFLSSPLVDPILTEESVDSAAFVERRKRENLETIMKKFQI